MKAGGFWCLCALITLALCSLGQAAKQKPTVIKLASNGSVYMFYSGKYKNNQPKGRGSSWRLTYEGNWSKGQMEGNGTLYFAEGFRCRGSFNTGLIQSGVAVDDGGDTTGFDGGLNGCLSALAGGKICHNFRPEVKFQLKKKKDYYTVLSRGKVVGYYLGEVIKNKKKKLYPEGSGRLYMNKIKGSWKKGQLKGKLSMAMYPGVLFNGKTSDGEILSGVVKVDNKVVFRGKINNTEDMFTLLKSCGDSEQQKCIKSLTVSGSQCKLPFFYGEKVYKTCLSNGSGRSFCSTTTDDMGVHNYNYDLEECKSNAPKDESVACQTMNISQPSNNCPPLDRNKQPIRILFLGNSYTYFNDVPGKISSWASNNGFMVQVDKYTPGGATMTMHYNNGMSKIAADWDVVVIQGQSQRSAFGPAYVQAEIYPYVRQIVDEVRKRNPCAIPVYFQTWGRLNGDQDNCRHFQPLCTFEGMQSLLTGAYNMYAYGTRPSRVAPVGEAFKRYGTRGELYTSDKSHPSADGSDLAAAVIYQTIFGEKIIGKTNAYLSELADQTIKSQSWSF